MKNLWYQIFLSLTWNFVHFHDSILPHTCLKHGINVYVVYLFHFLIILVQLQSEIYIVTN